MINSLERRVSRALATTNDVMARSQRVVWCCELDQMPAMIDLLIEQGRLSESDRPSCVHWRAIKGATSPTDEEVSLMVDAEEMLAKAGIRTVMAQARDALMQSADALRAFIRDRYGELDADDISAIQKLEQAVAPRRPSRS
jgi:hypothetical protein